MHKSEDEQVKGELFETYCIIQNMLSEGYEFWCRRHGIHSENPKMFSAMFFKEPADWIDSTEGEHMEYFEYINSYKNAGHGETLLEAVEKARKITLEKGL